jgi:DNA-binding transcriptional regulator LsrR (DeoR family)
VVASDPVAVAQAALMTNVARRFYLREQTKQEIAAELGISRFRVARLLENARRLGIVRIEIGMPRSIDAALSLELQESCGLRYAIVLDVPEEPVRPLLRRLGQAASELLCEILTKEDVLGLATARSLLGIGDGLSTFPASTVVQLTGAVSRPDALDIIQGIRGLTAVGGGPAFVYYAPVIGTEVISTAKRHPDVARAFDMIPRVTVAMVGIGKWAPTMSTIYDVAEPEDRRAAAEDGVSAEVAGVLLDEQGRPVQTALTNRILAPTYDQLMNIPTRIGVTFGSGRASAIQAAISGKVVNSLITHRTLADELLKLA